MTEQTTLTRYAGTREAAHEAIKAGYEQCKTLIALERRVKITVEEAEDERSVQQNRFYWGPCLREISEQAVKDGSKWSADAWHEAFKRVFLGYEIVKVKVAGRKRPTTYRRLRSTTDLSVRAMSKYLDEIQAHAASEMGVRFSVPDWYAHAGVDRPAPRKKAAARQPEEVEHA